MRPFSALLAAMTLGCGCPTLLDAHDPPPQVTVDPDGTVHLPAFDVPLSSYMSEAAKQSYIRQKLHRPELSQQELADIRGIRTAVDRVFFNPLLARVRKLYPVTIEQKQVGSVRTDVITPRGGVSKLNRNRVLVLLHGGAFRFGAGAGGLVEAIPIAATGRIKVISVDYRQWPEYKFPAASEDVAAVYRELLRHYEPRNIGIYGESAGGILTAMAIAWFRKENLPMPAAIGLFFGADGFLGGDSLYMSTSLTPLLGSNDPPPPAAPNPPPQSRLPYLSDVEPLDPLVSPTLHPEMARHFPPTLLITGSRDYLASSVFRAHSELVKARVEADLHVWEGMWHAFFLDPDLPESREAYDVIVRFFERHLGNPS